MAAPDISTSGRRYRKLLSILPARAAPSADMAGIGAGRRALSIGLALLITGVLLIMLLAFGVGKPVDVRDEQVTLVTLEAAGNAEQSPETDNPKREQAKESPPSPPPETPPQAPQPLPPPPVVEPMPAPALPAPSTQPPAPRTPRAVIRPSDGQVYGPANRGGAASQDTPQVGTAPNGEPLYAAAWYREPSDDELRGYLSTASGPGWGLIACRTASEYRVEGCVALDEYPQGSQINRAILAAAWQFRVRPPRRGGRLMVGSWVRIRIDYAIGRR
ncbi:hypothetical protein [Sphingopyxis indica]|nr:hypothetical protein [Sphingopyxis indica]